MPTWVGDVVMTTPALRALRGRFPDAHIVLTIRPNTRDVVEDGPWMDEVIEWRPVSGGLGQLSDTRRFARRLRAGQFDWAVLLSNAFRMALLTAWARIPRRIGYDRDGRGFLLTDRLPPRREGRRFAMISAVHYYNELVESLDCPPPGERMDLFTNPQSEATVQRRLEQWGIVDHHPLVVINPGASFGLSKLWMPGRYAEVGDRLIEEQDARIVVTCGPGEEALAWRIHDTMRHKPFVMDKPRGTLSGLKALIRRCDLLLNNDTGPRHFAKAFDRPVVTVFGSTWPQWTDTDYLRERKVRIDVDCGPCQKKVCPYEHHKCMTGVTAQMVYDAACELLNGSAVPLGPHMEAR